jgi:hypothetical protein
MTAKLNMKKMIGTKGRDLEKNFFESNKAIIEFEEVRRDEGGNFVSINEEKLIFKLTKDLYLSIGRSRGEEYYEESYSQKSVITKTGEKIEVDYVCIRIGFRGTNLSPIKMKRLNMVGRYNVPKKKIGDAMSTYQVEIYMKRVLVSGKEMYAVAIKNVGIKNQKIRVYDEKSNKIGDIYSGEELVVGKGTFYLKLPGAYLLKNPDFSIADENVFLKVTLS